MTDFNNLVVWKRSHALTLLLYRATVSCHGRIPEIRNVRLRARSVELPRRFQPILPRGAADGDMGRFVQIAMGSASERDYLSLLAKALGYLQSDEGLTTELSEIRRMLTVFYKRIRLVPEKQTAQPFAKS